jgi:hypothetical protein
MCLLAFQAAQESFRGTIAYNDFLVQDVLSTGTMSDEVWSQAHDDDSTNPLQDTSAELQWAGNSGGEGHRAAEV